MTTLIPRISIVGAGIAGLVVGRCLLQQGVRAVLFEKSRPSQNRNQYGITLRTSSYRPLLKMLGVSEIAFFSEVRVDAAVPVDAPPIESGSDGVVRVNRSRFEGFLREGLDIHYDHHLESIDSSSGLTLAFSNGASHKTDLVIGADGVHSRTRQHVSPETDFKILPYAVFNGKRRVPREEFNIKLNDYLHLRHVLKHCIEQVIFSISIDNFTEEEVGISYNYSRPARSHPDPLYRPERSKSEATAIPEAFFEEVATHQLEEPYKTVFDADAMREDRVLNWLMRTLQVNYQPLEVASKRGIVLIGESVHAEPILGGYGANDAIEDGMSLAEMLVDGRSNLSQFYEKRYHAWTSDITASERRIESMHSGSKSCL